MKWDYYHLDYIHLFTEAKKLAFEDRDIIQILILIVSQSISLFQKAMREKGSEKLILKNLQNL